MRFATAAQVGRRFDLSLKRTYRRLPELTRQGLAWHRRALAGQPGVWGVTGAGAGAAEATAGASVWNWRVYHHTLALVDLYTELERRYEVHTERELLAELYAEGLPEGPRPHLPDGDLRLPDGHRVALELERTAKAQARLRRILRRYARDRRYEQVWYFCPPGVLAQVEGLARGADWLRLHPWPPDG